MRRLLLISIATLLFITACNGTKKTNARNFTKAIDQYIAKHGDVCTAIVRQFPIDVPLSEQKEQYGIGSKLAALEQAFNYAARSVPPEKTSGLVEMQKWFAKLHR